MTDIQLLLSIGVPSLLVVLSWLSNNSRLGRAESRLDAMDKRLDAMDVKFDRRFDEIEKRLNDIIAAVHTDTLEIMRAMTALHERVAVIEVKQGQ